MKLLPTTALLVGFLTMTVAAAEKPAKKNWWWPWGKEESKPSPSLTAKRTKKAPASSAASRSGRRSTLPPKSEMIVVSPPTGPAVAGQEPAKLFSSEMSGKDLYFLTEAVQAGRRQAFLVELLEAQAESEQIKKLGTAFAATQEEENLQITRLAGMKGWTVSTEPTSAQKKIAAELEKKTGPAFDKAVMDRLIVASQQATDAYEMAAQSADPQIKSFAQLMLPIARQKLRLAETLTGAGSSATRLFRTSVAPQETSAEGNAPVQSPGAK